MSQEKGSGTRDELRRYTSDLFSYGILLAVLFLALKAGCFTEFPSVNPLPSEQQGLREVTTLPDHGTILSAVRGTAVLECSQIELETLLIRDRTLDRWMLPDGHVSIWINVPTVVAAGVDLSRLQAADLTINHLGNRAVASLQLPAPTITSVKVDAPGIRWGSSSDFPLIWDPDSEILGMRTELIAEARHLSSQTAIDAGLLPEARIRSVETVSRVLLSFGIDEVTVTFPDGQTRQTHLSDGRGHVCSSM